MDAQINKRRVGWIMFFCQFALESKGIQKLNIAAFSLSFMGLMIFLFSKQFFDTAFIHKRGPPPVSLKPTELNIVFRHPGHTLNARPGWETTRTRHQTSHQADNYN
jgi:hypothetical protein